MQLEKEEKLRFDRILRFEVLEFRIFWEGSVNRKDLTEFFDVSNPLIALDFREYQKVAPDNIEYNSSKRAYEPSEKFSPIFISTDPNCYFHHLMKFKNCGLFQNKSILRSIPEYDSVFFPEKNLNRDLLKSVIKSVNEKLEFKMLYRSMTQDESNWRWICPIAFFHDGFRWQIRAFCHMKNQFKDFALSRITEIASLRSTDIKKDEDHEWNSIKHVEVVPHPSFSGRQREIIESDYGMIDGVTSFAVRGALVCYFLRLLGLTEGHEKKEAIDQPIVLKGIRS